MLRLNRLFIGLKNVLISEISRPKRKRQCEWSMTAQAA
jgi:hypothetical protein